MVGGGGGATGATGGVIGGDGDAATRRRRGDACARSVRLGRCARAQRLLSCHSLPVGEVGRGAVCVPRATQIASARGANRRSLPKYFHTPSLLGAKTAERVRERLARRPGKTAARASG